jgi:zinc/manganese transport system permease protein
MLHFVEVLGLPFLACVAMTAILGYLGIHVLSREIVFVDIALAQIVAVGAVGAHLAFGVDEHSLLTYGASLALALGAAAFYALVRRRVLQISQEAVIGVSYAIAAAAALFLIGVAPGGHVHTQHMLAGSILWASWTDLIVCALVFGAAGVCFYVLRHPFQRISGDYDAAVREGMKVVAWDFLFYALLGIVITFAVRTGGVVVVFAFLIIPATLSALFTARLGRRLLIAWGAGVLGALLGLLFAQRLDFSVGPAVALFLGVELALAGLWRRRSALVAGSTAAAVSVGYVVLLVAAPSPHAVPAGLPEGSVLPGGETVRATSSPARSTPPAGFRPERIGRATTGGELAVLFERAPDTKTLKDVALRALEVEPRCGVQLALRYLREDPPLFFRQSVVDRLGDLGGEPLDWDVMQPFGAPVNAGAVERLEEGHRLGVPPPPCR